MAIPMRLCARAYLEAHRHVLDAADKARAHALDGRGELDRFEPLRQLAKHHLQFEARQICAEAEMLADAKRDVVIGIAADIEMIGRGEEGFVAVRRRIEERENVAFADLLTMEFGVL